MTLSALKYVGYLVEDGLTCDDCLLREQERHPMYLRIRHVDRGRILPSGRKLDERCESCGGLGRIPYSRVW